MISQTGISYPGQISVKFTLSPPTPPYLLFPAIVSTHLWTRGEDDAPLVFDHTPNCRLSSAHPLDIVLSRPFIDPLGGGREPRNFSALLPLTGVTAAILLHPVVGDVFDPPPSNGGRRGKEPLNNREEDLQGEGGRKTKEGKRRGLGMPSKMLGKEEGIGKL